jgi:hypothetical protein
MSGPSLRQQWGSSAATEREEVTLVAKIRLIQLSAVVAALAGVLANGAAKGGLIWP